MEHKVCACCGQKTLDPFAKFFDICPVCGWEDDPVQNEDPDFWGGANHISLNTAREAYAEGKALRPLKKAAFQRYKDGLKAEEAQRKEPVTDFV